MITIGNFFFKYRNLLFIVLYLLLFVPSPPLFSEAAFGSNYYIWPLVLGLLVTVTGQITRGMTIGLAYIIRGGKDGKVHADQLVTQGIFNHCRNPLYVGNILMLAGVGILANSLLYMSVIIPLFLFIYQSIVLAEENFLRGKFGESFETYCKKVNRWVPSLKGISATFSSMKFKWKRWLIKEYNTQFVWLTGITLIILFKYPQLTQNDTGKRNVVLAVILPVLLLYYFTIRYLKKSGRWND
ncbi:S-isoprenylcysteine methyltransferase [Terrimonas sp.]|uniref:methyltransferase family protein n=1 Tax=Terrimonas sp. TaxID=1914338 RepID=UPI000D5217FA|nr:isoprenylcysteine carboxylmethyltransferase family protein [Terrimonas sp.]PVD49714.1 S-isoprenylcysteine methyltransferase [Terrimonas sp.]PVD49972.1 S-isoprenylcysteine methyltransferase [Terrimonas sp.]